MFSLNTFIALALATSVAQAAPQLVSRQATNIDAAVLNFALTLEHLEAAFYKQGLEHYNQQAFDQAGVPTFARDRFKQVAAHESTHVEFLSTALKAAGAKPVQACTYKFPGTSPNDFINLSTALENVGTSAYTGAAQFITSKAYLTAAASILTVEARHTAWVNSAVAQQNPWNTAFDIPLSVNQVYTLASAFIVSCPESNNAELAALQLKASPALAVPASARPGKTTSLTFDSAGKDASKLFVAFLTGSGPVFAKLGGDKKVTVPSGLIGTVYAVVTSDDKSVSDANTVAGPAIVNFNFNSRGRVIEA